MQREASRKPRDWGRAPRGKAPASGSLSHSCPMPAPALPSEHLGLDPGAQPAECLRTETRARDPPWPTERPQRPQTLMAAAAQPPRAPERRAKASSRGGLRGGPWKCQACRAMN